MKHGSPALRVLVGSEDHGASSDVAVVDDVIEDVGCIVSVGEVANLVDDEHVRSHVDGECVAELSFATRRREIVDELGGGGEECVESGLQCAVRDGDREMRLAASGLALEDDRAAFGNEVRREERADGSEPKRRLVTEVVLLDGAQEWECCGTEGTSEASATAMRNFLGEERKKEGFVDQSSFSAR